jgi:hypothetical protein
VIYFAVVLRAGRCAQGDLSAQAGENEAAVVLSAQPVLRNMRYRVEDGTLVPA